MGRYPDAAKKYNINDSSMSRQLPTVILFKNGREITRRPAADNRGKLIKFFFSEVKDLKKTRTKMLFQIISRVDFGYNYDLLAQGIHKMVLVFKFGIFI